MRRMVNLLLIGAGGFFGAISRYGIGVFVERFPSGSKFPYATLAVNLIGCLLIGVAFGFAAREAISKPAGLLLVTGFLGGFTTFSTFGLDTLKLLHSGSVAPAMIYVLASVIAGTALVAAGYGIAK